MGGVNASSDALRASWRPKTCRNCTYPPSINWSGPPCQTVSCAHSTRWQATPSRAQPTGCHQHESTILMLHPRGVDPRAAGPSLDRYVNRQRGPPRKAGGWPADSQTKDMGPETPVQRGLWLVLATTLSPPIGGGPELPRRPVARRPHDDRHAACAGSVTSAGCGGVGGVVGTRLMVEDPEVPRARESGRTGPHTPPNLMGHSSAFGWRRLQRLG